MPRGGFIFREGEPASAVQIAAAGRIKIVRETATGRQVVLRLIHPGEAFGVAGGWGTARYPASARALDAAVVLRLPASDFARLLAAHHPLALAVIADLGSRLREAEARFLDLETEGVEARLARALLRLISPVGPVAAPASIALTRQDLADLVGTTGPAQRVPPPPAAPSAPGTGAASSPPCASGSSSSPPPPSAPSPATPDRRSLRQRNDAAPRRRDTRVVDRDYRRTEGQHDLRDHRAVPGREGCLLRRGLPGGLHPLRREPGDVLHRPRRVHRLRRVRVGLPGQRDVLQPMG